MSRTDAKSTSLRRRPTRSTPATLVAIVLLALGVGSVWVAVLKLSQGSWPPIATGLGVWLSGTTWAAAAVTAISIALAVLGLVLLAAAFLPGQPNALRLDDPIDPSNSTVGATEYVITRRSVARLAAANADLVDGVDSVSATASAQRVALRIATSSEQRGEIEQQVVDQVRTALSAAGVTPQPRVVATVRTQL